MCMSRLGGKKTGRSIDLLISAASIAVCRLRRSGHCRTVGEHERIVGFRRQRVDRNSNHTGLERAEKSRRPVDRVEEADQNALFALGHLCAASLRPRIAADDARRHERVSAQLLDEFVAT